MVRYKVIVSNKNIYREQELLPDNKMIKIGTTKQCGLRLAKELFFCDIELTLINNEGNWTLVCDETSYVSTDGIVKLATKELVHGDDLVLKYKDSNQEIFLISFVLDFEYENKNYHKAISIGDRDVVTIGGRADCDIYLKDPLVTNDIVLLQKENGQFWIVDNQTKYGVYYNGIKMKKKKRLEDFNFFSIVGYSFYYKYGVLYTAKTGSFEVGNLVWETHAESNGQFEYPVFNRSTRIKYNLPKEEVPVLDPPSPPTQQEKNLLMSLIPAFSMLAITVLVRGQMGGGGAFVIFSALSMGVGIITSIVTFISQGRKYKKDTRLRIEKYNEYIEDKKKLLQELRREERATLEEIYYSPERELEIIQDFSDDLFNRTPEDEDYLCLRVGTGAVLSNQPVGYKPQEKFESEDELANMPAALEEEFRFLTSVPVVVSGTENNALGVVGLRKHLYAMMKNLLLDATTRHYYNDLQLFFLVEPERVKQVGWIRFLPHLYNDHLDMRNIICDDESKNILFEYLYKLLSMRENNKITHPHIVIFVYDDMGIKNHPLSNFIEKAGAIGVTFIFFEERKELLPLGCGRILLLNENETSGQVVSSQDETEFINFSYEPIDDAKANYFAQKLAPVYCEEISLESTLTKNISLFELLDIYSEQDIDLAQNWEKAEIYKSMAAPLGVKSKNEVVALDLHEKFHGPHGLVAGTTGSGKSEILQSYILSMATRFHPYEVGFVIIDFKGGGMVNQFKNLPHLIGAITNIDGREIDRSLLSIKAELRKRQALFAKQEVNHIDAYIKLFKQGKADVPLPHLILIVDEFAELKMDQPDFMKELVSAARIGRSLGVHLILATQKPSGVVDAQIWSNSKFKLCLKVQNKEDSNEVLKSPLAAEIKEPGRAYLQVGNNEIFELFQSAYSGAPATTDTERKKKFEVYGVSFSGRKSVIYQQKPDKGSSEAENQLDAIVRHVAEHCVAAGIKQLPGICQPPLREMISYSEVTEKESDYGAIQIPMGVYDDPNNQLQEQIDIDILAGNTIVVGASQFGKTNLLQLVLRGIASRYTPEEVNVYVMDFASMALKVFESLKHVGGVVTASEDVKLKTLFRMLNKEIEQRKEKFSKLGITSFASYRDAGYTDLPAIVLLLDNLAVFREMYETYEDVFLNFCREGLAVGISIFITINQTRGVGYKYLSNFANPIALYCNQKDEYNTLFERCRISPKNAPGRGLVMRNKEIFEYQNYLAFEGEKEIDRVAAIKKFIDETSDKYPTLQAKLIPDIPPVLTLDYLQANFDTPPQYNLHAGLDYDTVDTVTFDFVKMGYVALGGGETDERATFIKYVYKALQQNLLMQPVQSYIVDDYARGLEDLEEYDFVQQYVTDIEDLAQIIQQVDEEAQRRREKLKTFGLNALASEPLLFITVHNEQFLEKDGMDKATADACIKLLKGSKDIKIFFMITNLQNMPISFSGPDVLKHIKENKNIMFFDNLPGFKIMDVAFSELKNFKKPIQKGDAHLITDGGTVRLKTPIK